MTGRQKLGYRLKQLPPCIVMPSSSCPLRHNGKGRATTAKIDNPSLMRYQDKIAFSGGLKMRETSH